MKSISNNFKTTSGDFTRLITPVALRLFGTGIFLYSTKLSASRVKYKILVRMEYQQQLGKGFAKHYRSAPVVYSTKHRLNPTSRQTRSANTLSSRVRILTSFNAGIWPFRSSSVLVSFFVFFWFPTLVHLFALHPQAPADRLSFQLPVLLLGGSLTTKIPSSKIRMDGKMFDSSE